MQDEYRPDGKLGMSFSIERGRLLVYHATILELGEPGYVRFLYNDGKRRLAIQCCEKIDKEGFRVPKVAAGGLFQFEISAEPLLSVIYKKCDWDPGKAYTVFGTSYPEHRLVEFRFDDAVMISADQFIDPENAGVLGR